MAGFSVVSVCLTCSLITSAATAEWERQRDNEAAMEDRFDFTDDFVDGGAAIRFFQNNRGRILRQLSGASDHEKGDFDWYSQWEEWARRQWEQQQRNQYQQQYQQQQQTRTSRPKKETYQWEFDPNDPYAVLGIKRGATKSEVSGAYRRNMLKWHPDTQSPNATDAENRRAEERSKLINEAYRKIKAETKR
jgi:DnaJ-domain-containing protein 1